MTLLTLGRRHLEGHPLGLSVTSMLADVGTPASTVETDLANFTLPPSLLAKNGDMIQFKAALRTAANANTKRARVYFGGVQIYDTAATADNAATYLIHGLITRRALASQEVYVSFQRHNTGTNAARAALTVDLSLATIFRVTGTNGTATANDLILSQLAVTKLA